MLHCYVAQCSGQCSADGHHAADSAVQDVPSAQCKKGTNKRNAVDSAVQRSPANPFFDTARGARGLRGVVNTESITALITVNCVVTEPTAKQSKNTTADRVQTTEAV